MSAAPTFPYPGSPMPGDKLASVGKCQTSGKEVSICYQTFGNPSDPCLLLVSGLSASLLIYREELCQKLADQGFFVVRFDNRDVGLSTHFSEYQPPFIARMILPAWASVMEGTPCYTLNDMARDAFGLLTALHIDKAHIMGGSMGGMIVQCMSLLAPERVLSQTIVYSHSGGPSVKGLSWEMCFSFLDKSASTGRDDMIDFKMRVSRRFTTEYYPLDDADLREYTALSWDRAGDDPAGMLRQMWAIQRAENREPLLAALPPRRTAPEGVRSMPPTLILHGMQDTMIPLVNGERLAELISDSKLVVFPRMGHSLPKVLFDDIVSEVSLLKKERNVH